MPTRLDLNQPIPMQSHHQSEPPLSADRLQPQSQITFLETPGCRNISHAKKIAVSDAHQEKIAQQGSDFMTYFTLFSSSKRVEPWLQNHCEQRERSSWSPRQHGIRHVSLHVIQPDSGLWRPSGHIRSLTSRPGTAPRPDLTAIVMSSTSALKKEVS